MKPNRFVPWIQDVTQRYGTDILRMKGIASIEDDDRQFVVQSVHMLIEGGSRRPWKQQEPRRWRRRCSGWRMWKACFSGAIS